MGLVGLGYRRHPELKRALARREAEYNASIDFLEGLEREGRAFVVRPDGPIPVGRTENDAAKLEALFHSAERHADRIFPELRAWLG